MLDKSVNWVTEYNKKFDKREFRPIVMNTEGKSVLVTRYFRPIKPPEELIEKDATSFETAVCLNNSIFLYFNFSILNFFSITWQDTLT